MAEESSGMHWTDDVYRKGIALTGGVCSSELLEHVFSILSLKLLSRLRMLEWFPTREDITLTMNGISGTSELGFSCASQERRGR
ncbi:MAG: hypothetical protein AM324_008355, partial [Candidatus Thorarchaeota archaeon SMTZ1-83]